jgi:hypothetical protein
VVATRSLAAGELLLVAEPAAILQGPVDDPPDADALPPLLAQAAQQSASIAAALGGLFMGTGEGWDVCLVCHPTSQQALGALATTCHLHCMPPRSYAHCDTCCCCLIVSCVSCCSVQRSVPSRHLPAGCLQQQQQQHRQQQQQQHHHHQQQQQARCWCCCSVGRPGGSRGALEWVQRQL